MTRLLTLLILLAPAALGREPFPADYKPSPCARPACQSFPQSQIAEVAALRGWDVGQEWVDAHWSALMAGMEPVCAKLATCLATPCNDPIFCNDVIAVEAHRICNRYPEGSKDREKCTGAMSAYLRGVDSNSHKVFEEAQSCLRRQPPRTGERTFEYWITPERIGPDYAGHFTVYAIDSETRVPVKADVFVEGKTILHAESQTGSPMTFYQVEWKPRFVRAPNAQGHSDVVAPLVRIEAPGYRTETFRMPVDVPKMIVEMNPPPAKLKRGRNSVTVTALDSVTGKPVEARVMGGEIPLGKTNVPFELEWKKGEKRPEIWVTNLFDRYSDVVVAPAEK